MNWKLKSVMGAAVLALASHAMAQITFYEGEHFRGRAFTTDHPVGDFGRFGFNDRASSVVVDHGRWEVCEDDRFRGRCVVLRRGSYDSLRALGMERRISSVRPVDDRGRYDNEAPPPVAAPAYEYRRRPDERTFEVPVSTVHAVVGPPNQRCWVEHQQVAQPNQPNVGGAIVGGLIGGVLGHQVGGGSGKDLATAGGAVAGAVIGSNVAGGGGGTTTAEVRRCETVANTTPAYWDVSYFFQGTEHHVQMSAPPGRTIVVNSRGEPRQ
jgi:uncharacterized protein YcfJ